MVGSASEDIHEYPTEGQYPTTTPSGKQPIDHSDTTHVPASALVYCIKTTRFKLLCATVVEHLSSAWPVIATVTRWNPLACVGVDWAMYVIPTLAMLAMLRVVSGLVHLGDGLEWNAYVGNVRDVLNMFW